MPKKYRGGNNLFQNKKCPICGKVFSRISFNDYAYKEGAKFFCCYTCMRTAERRGLIKNVKKSIRS